MKYWLLPLSLFSTIAGAACASGSCVQTKELITADGARYVYDYVPAKGNQSTALLLHGYPGTRHDWHGQVADLAEAGYGVVAPDCLGYGDSDLPTEVEAYNLKRLSGHLTEILDNEGIQAVTGVGHDWGSTLLSRSANWHPERFDKLAFLSVGYSPAGIFLDVDALNALGLEQLGYMQLGYFYFFNSYNAADLAATNLESYFSLAFPNNISSWAIDLAQLGAARSWLTANTSTPTPSYLDEEDKRIWMSAYGQDGAVEASMNYYKALMRGVNARDEEVLTDDDRTLKMPVLAIGGTKDMVTRADQIRAQTEPWAAAGYTERTVDTGHWMAFEDRDGVSSHLLEFFAQ